MCPKTDSYPTDGCRFSMDFLDCIALQKKCNAIYDFSRLHCTAYENKYKAV